MKIFEFYGGPGSGKTTAASGCVSYFKQRGYDVEFSREFAQQVIYSQQEHLLDSQPIIAIGQYGQYYNMKCAGVPYCFSDSSITLSKFYGNDRDRQLLMPLLEQLETEFEIVRIFVERAKPFKEFGRVHGEDESLHLDKQIKAAYNFDYICSGDEAGLLDVMRWLSQTHFKDSNA